MSNSSHTRFYDTCQLDPWHCWAAPAAQLGTRPETRTYGSCSADGCSQLLSSGESQVTKPLHAECALGRERVSFRTLRFGPRWHFRRDRFHTTGIARHKRAPMGASRDVSLRMPTIYLRLSRRGVEGCRPNPCPHFRTPRRDRMMPQHDCQ